MTRQRPWRLRTPLRPVSHRSAMLLNERKAEARRLALARRKGADTAGQRRRARPARPRPMPAPGGRPGRRLLADGRRDGRPAAARGPGGARARPRASRHAAARPTPPVPPLAARRARSAAVPSARPILRQAKRSGPTGCWCRCSPSTGRGGGSAMAAATTTAPCRRCPARSRIGCAHAVQEVPEVPAGPRRRAARLGGDGERSDRVPVLSGDVLPRRARSLCAVARRLQRDVGQCLVHDLCARSAATPRRAGPPDPGDRCCTRTEACVPVRCRLVRPIAARENADVRPQGHLDLGSRRLDAGQRARAISRRAG